jgi:hypothetical protein
MCADFATMPIPLNWTIHYGGIIFPVPLLSGREPRQPDSFFGQFVYGTTHVVR